ncbi:neuralized-like protein 4 isoform X2 [Ornithodoros turicata]|uniref:neuralized-like protein 4 isoform X2 n=1 Tax=Ornithodoros turicata TaxID=34597 RepID=UPI003138CDCE
MAPYAFHQRRGYLVTISNENRTAHRIHPHQEFNNGIVMSAEPLCDNQLFEVRIDKKISTWSGSIEIGVTTLDPSTLTFPSSATNLRDSSWVMSGIGVLQDGKPLVEEYGVDLDQLGEGDKVGVMRTSSGDLVFFVNGHSQGVAATRIPPQIYVVVDLYGKCAQVTIVDSSESRLITDNISNGNVGAERASTNSAVDDSPLRFHARCGQLVCLTNNNRTAERKRPSEEFNNGVVMTHRPLRQNEWFEIRIDELMNKWSGSIELGVTTHNPDVLDFPPTMTNMRSGTIMMSGSGILTNGKGSRREYGDYNLDELHEGDTIGVVCRSNGNLHYYINGVDQGIASSALPDVVFGVVDLYGMTVKVTLVDHNETPDTQVTSPNDESKAIKDDTNDRETGRLLFHPKCGPLAVVTNGGLTALRPSALNGFNDAVVLTNRALRPNEVFEVVLERLVSKWSGSLDIGVTVFPPHSLEFPTTITNIRSGTWVMTGRTVMHNGTEIVNDYCRSLDSLEIGDRIGVMKTAEGDLHFYINGVDQGVAAHSIPSKVYGVLDLYGRAAQASIVESTAHDTNSLPVTLAPVPSPSLALGTVTTDLRFSDLHGRNARVLNNGLTAVRPNAHGEFNYAIVVSSRPLEENEIFEVIIDQMVDRWSGSIEAGVTAIPLEELEFPSTMTDIDHDTWMLSGSSIMRDGNTVRNGYKCDLDQLSVGSRIGMMRDSEGCLHYFINGEDQGIACRNIPQINKVASPEAPRGSITPALGLSTNRQFSARCGKHIVLRNGNMAACRTAGFNNALVFSAAPLELEELFEVQVEQVHSVWAGTLVLGLTSFSPESAVALPPSSLQIPSSDTWLLIGSRIHRGGLLLRDSYGPSLHRIAAGERIGVQHCSDGTLHIHLNGEDLGPAAFNLPKALYAVLDLYGAVESISLCSSSIVPARHSAASNCYDTSETGNGTPSKERVNQEFHESHGRNVQLRGGNLVACRVASYNQGIVVSSKPLPRCQLFQVRIDRLNPRWTSSLQIGVVRESPEKLQFPPTALGLRKLGWTICGDSVHHGGTKIKGSYGPNLDNLQPRHTVGVLVDLDNNLHLFVNGVDQGIAAQDIPPVCYALVDLYGQCEQVTVLEHHNQDSGPDTDSGEKADIDNGVKEKQVKNIHNDLHAIKNCEYQNSCVNVKAMLGIPDGYFLSEPNMCYCETCHKIRGDEPYNKVGEPPRDYAVPFGWCRFSLRPVPNSENSLAQEKWHVAYHGIPVSAIRKTLDHGELLSPDDVLLCHAVKPTPKSRAENLESKSICLSPTLRYAGNSSFSPKHVFTDTQTGRQVQVRAAFQVLVRPGSYTVHPACASSRDPIDVHFSNSELEWRAKERGATVLRALLLRIETS